MTLAYYCGLFFVINIFFCFFFLTITLIGGIILSGSIVGSSIAEFTGKADFYEANLTDKYNAFIGLDEAADSTTKSLLDEVGIKEMILNSSELITPSTLIKWTTNIMGSVQSVFKNIFLIIISMIFILTEMGGFKHKIDIISQHSPDTKISIDKFITSLRRYIGLKSLISFITGVVITIWVSLLGLDFPFLWGMTAFLLNFIPTIGSIVAAIPAILLALVQLSFPQAGLVAIGYIVTNSLVGNIIEPKVMGDGLGLSTLVVFLSLIFWGWIFGIAGMLLAVPLTMSVKIALESSPNTQDFAMMLGAIKPKKKKKAKTTK
ncbi:MAG: hypothetical protein B6226_05415 [Candidatus Cloacimonetes bacterium 4572_65]|nr:MAG: hypothetical protein B6226_05415 [Candidatus Cloacimonetes bacterium 4572_65]